ncbi:maltase A1-like [Bradysia coprophila]|uniref:maltase A1-like n=1 Tax=Bradysia coprophila TaxID=38358 RepID=UPI00187DB676|nr:maltase A1-like [Bradysia coprophila]XP_037034888.1 maltase A1-like [Bradysia coprophila]
MWKISISFCISMLCASSAAVLAEDEWWENGHFYHIYVRSFQDSDNDGIGDLNGITSRLAYLKFIGVTGVWLSPIFKSPMVDFGYDISDFKVIQPEYGTMEDFGGLIDRCKELDIKLLLDFVPNHCSSEHEWFKKAIDPHDSDHNKYKDFFIWHKGKLLENGTRVPPNNWLSVFRGSAWEWVETMQAYYLHQFLEVQPDLNYRNPNVVEEMADVIRFWLRKGVSGFRVDAVPFIFEAEPDTDGNYADEPPSGKCLDDPLVFFYLNHTQTEDLDETYDVIYQWRKILEEKEFAGQTRILMSEGYTTLSNVMRYYGQIENGAVVEGKYGVQVPLNFLLQMSTQLDTKASEYKSIIDEWISSMPKGNKIQANWVLGNHDNKRIASKYRPSRIDLFNILLKTLPGITVTYYGEEIGMTDVWISWNETVDPRACRTDPDRYGEWSRDPVRSPFQWDSSKNSGFSSADKTWLPVADNFTDCNVQQQLRESQSHLKVFNRLMELRKQPTMKYGDLEIKAVDEELLVYKRQMTDDPDADIVIVVLNLERNSKIIDLGELFNGLPKQMKVVVTSIHSPFEPGMDVETSEVVISPEDGIVLVGNTRRYFVRRTTMLPPQRGT